MQTIQVPYFLKCVMLLFILLIGLLAGVRLYATNQPNLNFQILNSNSCSLPCWHNIQPGKTTLQEAETLLRVDKDISNIHYGWFKSFGKPQNQLCWNWTAHPEWQICAIQDNRPSDNTIVFIVFESPPNTFTVGDAITMFGLPALGQTCVSDERKNSPTNGDRLDFDHNVSIGIAHDPRRSKQLTPSLTVKFIQYVRPDPSAPVYRIKWRGFDSLGFGCDEENQLILGG